MLGQGANAQLHRADALEVPDQFRGGDADEARCQPALGRKGGGRTGGDGEHRGGRAHVLRQVEVVGSLVSRAARATSSLQ